MNGFLNILKPPGMTSAAVVACVRRMTGEKRVGHAGTLDPEAAGVLPVMVGRATRLFDYLVDKQKTYVAEVAFGTATDTQDATGTVISRGDRYPDRDTILRALPALTGEIEQVPSLYSAVKVDGKPLYTRAHRGESAEVPARRVVVESITLGAETPNHGWMLTVRCGRGTYIRTLCHDLGKMTGCPAHMRFLLRSQSGAFDLSTAVTLEEAQAAADTGDWRSLLLPMDWPLQHLPALRVSRDLAKLVRNGVPVPLPDADIPAYPEHMPARVYLENQFWGIAERRGSAMVWKAQMPPDMETNDDHQA